MQLEELFNNKKILMIPVYSTRSYDCGVYNLMADGNISKYLIKIMNSKAKEIDILYPLKSYGIEQIKKITNKKDFIVNWIPFNYGSNAHETRNMGGKFYDYIIGRNKQYDYIVSEVDTLAEKVITSNKKLCNKDNFIYWAGSWTCFATPWYEERSSQLNKDIANNILTACLLPGQVDLYKGKSFYDNCVYEPNLFDKKIIFFPFRLSDSSYHAKEFRDTIYELKNEGYDNFVVLFTDVNDSHIFDKELGSELFIKVPSNKFVYQAILKGMPIIPYLDNIDKNYHSNIFEFLYYNCKVIMMNNETFANNKDIRFISGISELKTELIKLLGD